MPDQSQVHEPALVTAPVSTMTGIVGEVCSGAMLKRGVYFGRSRSRFQRTRMSLNSNVAVKRPHISGCYNAGSVEYVTIVLFSLQSPLLTHRDFHNVNSEPLIITLPASKDEMVPTNATMSPLRRGSSCRRHSALK